MRAPLLSRSHRRRRRIQFPIEVFFDGDAGKFFIGGWSEVGGNVLNDQIELGIELLDNGDFADWTDNDPDDWGVTGEVDADPEISEVGAGQGHGGGGNGAVNFFSTASGNARLSQGVLSLDEWHEIATLISFRSSGTIRVRDLNDGIVGVYTSTGSKLLTGRSAGGAIRIRLLVAGDMTIDNISAKIITFTSIINTLKSQFGLSDGFFIDVHINAVTADTQVGVIWNYDGSNNFGMAYMDGTDLIVDKNVAGTYSNLASVAQAVTPDQILRIENPAGSNVLSIKYNGVEKATPTIADASVIGNTGIALFSTEANNKISKVTIGKL